MNVVHQLEERKKYHWNWGREHELCRLLSKHQVKLSTILHPIIQNCGHIVLGFTRSGDGLISYHSCIHSHYFKYTLFWWKFNLYKQISLVTSVEIFAGEEIDGPLQITLYDEGTWIYVLGCRRDRLTETRPCYISVMSSWPKVRCVDVFHFKLELLLHQPMVCVVNSTSPFKQDGILIINTGVCIVYVQCQKNHHPIDLSQANSPFLHVCYEYSCDSAAIVCVVFDVDSWIGTTVPSLFADNSLIYQYISDYNLDLFQVNTDLSVTVLVWVEIQFASQETRQYMEQHFMVIANWNIVSGVKFIKMYRFLNSTDSKRSRQIMLESKLNREMLYSPLSSVKEISNGSIFTGKSLSRIFHPYLPLFIVL